MLSQGRRLLLCKTTYANNSHCFFSSLSTKDKQRLCQNSFGRFAKSGNLMAHLVLPQIEQTQQCWQFTIPDAKDTPQWQPIQEVEVSGTRGQYSYQAMTINGVRLYASQAQYRLINRSSDTTTLPYPIYDVLIFSEHPQLPRQYQGPTQPQPYYPTGIIKGNNRRELNPKTIMFRRKNKTRNPIQSRVMGRSAQQACIELLQHYADILPDELQVIIRQAIHAPRNAPMRPEWLHAEAFSMTPKTVNPQRTDNLGSATSVANSHMMIMERLAQWFAFQKCYQVHYRSIFYTLFESDVVEAIDYIISIRHKANCLHLRQHLQPFQTLPPEPPHASDSAQLATITQALITGQEPDICQNIRLS